MIGTSIQSVRLAGSATRETCARARRLRPALAASTLCLALRLAFLLLALPFGAGAVFAQVVAVRGETVHTLAGGPISDGVVLVEDGRITAVGPASSVSIPDGARVLEAAVVTPGLVDVRSTVGLSGAYNSAIGPVRDQDQLETSSPIQPELRAIDAYNAREELIEYVRGFGITTLHTGHGPGALISGQTMIVKTRGATVEEALVEPSKMLAVTIGRLDSDFDTPGTLAKGIAMLRGALLEAQEYRNQRREAEERADEGAERRAEDGEGGGPGPSRNLRNETLAAALDGELTLMVNANTATDIVSALRLQREFGFDMVLDGAAESYLVLDQIEEAGVPVFLHPARARIPNKTFEIARILRDAGIPFAVQTGHEGYVPKTRVLLFEVAHYAANGLSSEQALAAVTLDAARLLGIDDRVGSLEVGKDGDLVLYDGDPFEYTSHVCAVLIEGEVVSEECR
ncbi:MAG TPA: amidohydrolase family protein [Thermoanaerobaculia bacterium]|nr:amidohydrolase family protein [Thermoanaerobaculia bacterium]